MERVNTRIASCTIMSGVMLLEFCNESQDGQCFIRYHYYLLYTCCLL